MVSVVAGPAGWASIDALIRHLDAERGDDPLAPATVICPNTVLVTGLRRAAVARCRDLGRPGLAGVDVTTVNRLAEKLALPALQSAGAHVAGRIELLSAIRETLRRSPGLFGPVADHRTTEDRLVAFFQEITGLPPELRDRLEEAAVGLAKDAFRVAREASEAMGTAFGEDRLIDLAVQELGLLPDGAIGPIVLYHPDPVRPYEGRLVQALGQRSDTTVVVPLTGHRRIDERYLSRLAAWGLPVEIDEEATARSELQARTATLVEVAAPDEEVRAAVRDLSSHAASGSRLEDMAVLYTYADPYASLLVEQLTAAGIPFRGPGHRSLSTSLVGRTLRRLLALAASGLDRGSVVRLLNSAPIDRGDGREVPALEWDRISRQAGVIDGEHWESRLAELAASIEADHADAHGPADAAHESAGRASAVADLAAFVSELRERLRPPGEVTWLAWARWAADLLDRYLILDDGQAGAVRGRRSWPQDEQAAAAMVDSLLTRVGGLDRFGGPPRLDTFEATVLSELNGLTVPGADDGRGVFVAPVSMAAGLPFRRISVVGAVEGQFPRVPREDSLLPDQLRARAGGLMIEKNVVTEFDIHRAALSASASASASTFFVARGDLRSSRTRVWPEALKCLVGPEPVVVASHHQGLVDHGRPASEEDFGLRALLAHVDGGDPVHTHVLAARDETLAKALRRHLDRNRSDLTPYTGRVRARMVDPVERVFSPTALETYALCPRKYLFQRVLRLQEDERPERIAEITARERGQLVHRVLERFLAEVIDEGTVPEPSQRWSPEQRARLLDILDEQIKLDQGRGVTGGEVRTRLLRQWLVTEMLNFLETDDALRRKHRSTPWAAEFSFGFDDSPALEGLVAGRSLRLRGMVDRVDLTADGGLMVIDYKGGSGRQFDKLDVDPLDGGRRLQLPLYARAVAEALHRDGPRTGMYWLTKENDVREVPLDDQLEVDLEEKVGAALDGISDGLFPAVPGSAVSWPRVTFENCRYCDFDRICPTDRQSEWERVKGDPELKPIQVVINDRRERG